MKLKELVPMLETENLKESIDFYTEVLDFECRGTFPNSENPQWTSLTNYKTVIMLTVRNSHTKIPNTTMTGSMYFYPENVEKAWEKLKDKAPVSYAIETFDYGMREFGILDPNGYLLQFGQDIDELKSL